MASQQSAVAAVPSVLVVDDDDDSRESVAEFLEGEGFEVQTARDGVEALELLDLAPPPLAMVLDMNMPRMHGREVLARVRANSALLDLPVCVLSGEVDGRLDEADLTIKKPLLVHRLVEVQRWLEECASRAASR